MKQKILTVLSVLFGLLLLNSGLNKLFNYLPMPENLPEDVVKDGAAMLEISWLMPLLAVAEIIGGLLIMFPRTRALGALILFPVMVGILLMHLFVDQSGLPMALVLWAILLWIIYENRARYYPLVKKEVL